MYTVYTVLGVAGMALIADVVKNNKVLKRLGK
jgi:hypothetical protein